ncbi:MAG: mobile mystery protein B [Saprospiraceae bacterium]|nr:mobile mystery protein B [Candidatus Opimibacter iunctus]
MGLALEYQNGETPLDEEEKVGLRIGFITTRGELDEYEQQNNEIAYQWVLDRNFKPEVIFTEDFVCNIHKRMFGEVWAWAGAFRKTNKNIGIEFWQIPMQLKLLLDDARFWHENKTFPPDEMALRFKHLLVSIHCFPNGNGRHSRLMADIMIEKIYKQPPFSWGAANLKKPGDARREYLKAVKAADKGDYNLLLSFARS